MNVADVMTRDVLSVAPQTPLREVARLLGERRISGVPVVDEAGTCLGVVSEAADRLAGGDRYRSRARVGEDAPQHVPAHQGLDEDVQDRLG